MQSSLNESSWIAARAFSKSPSGSPDAEAHTNPVYVHLNGRAALSARPTSIGCWRGSTSRSPITRPASVAEKAMPIEYFRRSREILLRDAASATADRRRRSEVRAAGDTADRPNRRSPRPSRWRRFSSRCPPSRRPRQ